jgi:hypothetical protein
LREKREAGDRKQETGTRNQEKGKKLKIGLLLVLLSFPRKRESVVALRIIVKNGIVFPGLLSKSVVDIWQSFV